MEVFNSNRCLGLMERHTLLHLALPCYCNCFPQKSRHLLCLSHSKA